MLRYLRFFFVGAVVVGIGLIFTNTAPRVSLETVLDLSRLEAEHLPELLQRIRDFHRTVTRDGEKLLEVSAKEASYFRDEKAVQILEPRLVFYDEGESVGKIEGGKGYLLMDGNAIERVVLDGGVEFQLATFKVVAESIEYERATERVFTRGETHVTSPEIELSGQTLTFDLTAKSLSVDADVDMMLRPTEENADSVTDSGRPIGGRS